MCINTFIKNDNGQADSNMILYWYIINYMLKILDKKLSNGEIIYTAPFSADTDGDGIFDVVYS